MNLDWQKFLALQGATINAGVVQHYEKPSAELKAAAQSLVLCELSSFGTLRVSGEEAQSFLQNLLSNDILEVSSTRAQLSSLNTAKGRMLATMLISRYGDDYLLQLPRVLCEPIRKKLSMYVLRAKVKITDASDEIISLGLSGANALKAMRAQFGELPQSPLGGISTPQGTVIRIGDTRFQINTTAQYAPDLWETLRQHAQPVGSACWDWLNIRSGIPVILPRTQEQFVAQMVNFDLIGGVSFKKGCYPGQEVVARMHYLGKLKRRMYLAHMDSGDMPQAGDELFSADDEEQLSGHRMEGQASGMIVNAAPAPDGGYDVLATVQVSCVGARELRCKSLQGGLLQFLTLPYSIPQVE